MKKYLSQNYSYFAAILFASLSCTSAIVYRLYSLNKNGVILSLIIAGVIFISFIYFLKTNNRQNKEYFLREEKKDHKKQSLLPFLILAYFAFFSASLFIIFSAQTSQAIISPWEVIPSYFFIFYGLTTTILIFTIASQEKSWVSLLLISFHYFLSFAVASSVYKIGYG
ncbi:MAG: hypothetical protein WC582_04320, partial [Patescibacteria group bacterium]